MLMSATSASVPPPPLVPPPAAPAPPVPPHGHWNQDRRRHTLRIAGRRQLPVDEVDRPAVLSSLLRPSVSGGSEHGQLILFSPCSLPGDWVETGGDPAPNDARVLLVVDGQNVSGFTRRDLLAWLAHCLLLAQQVDQSSPGGGTPTAVQITTAPLTGKSFIILYPFLPPLPPTTKTTSRFQ